ncbi:MAG: Fur family transcriptional regulator [Ferruginibacter sp.]
MDTIRSLLKKYQLSVTDSRVEILQLFLRKKEALSHGLIEKSLSDAFDRVTIYRTLQTFSENGLIHQIPTTDNTILYALCKEDCQAGHHHDDHVHFLCIHCGQTLCIDQVTVPTVHLPDGFKPIQRAMIVKGTCGQCA